MIDPLEHVCPMPPVEWKEGQDLDFETRTIRVFRIARFYVAAEHLQHGGAGVRFSIDGSVFAEKTDEEIADLVTVKTLEAIREARKSWKENRNVERSA